MRGAVVDDALRERRADAVESVELIGACAVQVPIAGGALGG